MTKHHRPLSERLLTGIEVDEDGCWIWQKGRMWGKYGWMRVMGTDERAVHRLAYTEWVGPIPESFDVDHECHNLAVKEGRCEGAPCKHQLCINPDHLMAKPRGDNLQASPLTQPHKLKKQYPDSPRPYQRKIT